MAVADCSLCLDRKKEGRDKTVDVVDARRPRRILQMVQITPWEEKENVWKNEQGKVMEWVWREWEDLYFKTRADIYCKGIICLFIYNP